MKKISGETPEKVFTPETLKKMINETVKVSAQVYRISYKDKFNIMQLKCGFHTVQAVYLKGKSGGDFSKIKEGGFAEVFGTVKEEKRAENGFEITVSDIKSLSENENLQPRKNADEHGDSLYFDSENRFLDLRNKNECAVMKIRSALSESFSESLGGLGFTEIFTPKTTAGAVSDFSHVFTADYFGADVILSNDDAMYMHAASAALGRVFEKTPVFKAHLHNSFRHLNEYESFNFHLSYVKNAEELMSAELYVIKKLLKHISDKCADELGSLDVCIPNMDSVPAVTYCEAMDMLEKSNDGEWPNPTDELRLCEICKSDFIFITGIPDMKCPIYIKDGESFVLVFRGYEISFGGIYVSSENELIKNADSRGISIANFSEYSRVLSYPMPPSGGVRIGAERLLMKLLHLSNIRQTVAFPRDIQSFKNS